MHSLAVFKHIIIQPLPRAIFLIIREEYLRILSRYRINVKIISIFEDLARSIM